MLAGLIPGELIQWGKFSLFWVFLIEIKSLGCTKNAEEKSYGQ